MLNKEQEVWLAHLDDKKKVEILPYNPETKKVFLKIKKELQDFLGDVEILHCGSTALEILGQGEIDCYIPVREKDFNEFLEKLIKHLGEPGSVYNLRRARFVKFIEDIKIEIFLINKNSDDWKNSVIFENYLKKNKEALKGYENLKINSNGLSVQEYYRRKLEFINKILNKCRRRNHREQ